jgi:hypothetical protein
MFKTVARDPLVIGTIIGMAALVSVFASVCVIDGGQPGISVTPEEVARAYAQQAKSEEIARPSASVLVAVPAPAKRTARDPVSECAATLGALDLAGVDTEKAIGAPSGWHIFARAQWCVNNQYMFGGR